MLNLPRNPIRRAFRGRKRSQSSDVPRESEMAQLEDTHEGGSANCSDGIGVLSVGDQDREISLLRAPTTPDSNNNPELLQTASSDLHCASVSNPHHIPSSPMTEVQSSVVGAQVIREPGANYWEVNGIWGVKRCSKSIQRSLDKIGNKTKLVVFFIALVGMVAWKYTQTPQLEVKKFLISLELGNYYENFIDNEYTWLEDVIHVTREELTQVGIVNVAHQKRILRHAERLQNQESVLAALTWGFIVAIAIIFMALVLSVLLYEEARKRATCLSLWACFMAWHRIRMYCRLWTSLDTGLRPNLGSSGEARPATPASDANPPDLCRPSRSTIPHMVE